MDSKTLIKNAIIKLKKHEIKFPHLEAEILLSFVLKKTREFLLTYPEYQLSKLQIKEYSELTKQRCKNIPVAYLLGQKEFYGFNFLVNKDVLIPRPETELMIDEIKKIVDTTNQKFTFIDIGTGSGCVIISLAKIFGLKHKYLASDISRLALIVARKNARLNNVAHIKFLRGDLLQPFFNSNLEIRNLAYRQEGLKLIITANLPYLTANQIKKSPSIKNEPHLALDGGKDGLNYYRSLLKQIKKSKINQAFILLEIDPTQKTKISSLIKKEYPQATLTIKKDLKGHSRLAIISLF
jgi:release factor glutamine methyltransferase